MQKSSPIELLIFTGYILACCLAAVGFLSVALPGARLGDHDFISYWATARQALHHANPYDARAILLLERSQGYAKPDPLFMRNPPTALVLAIPFGSLNPAIGSVMWLAIEAGALVATVRILRRMYSETSPLTPLLAFCFPACILCLAAEQLGLAILLGAVLFLRFREDLPMLAGAGLWLCAAKPHLFLPFAAVLALRAILGFERRPLAWAALFLAGSAVLSLAIDPHLFAQYAVMARHSGVTAEFVPTFATLLRFALHRGSMVLQFVPATVATTWAAWFAWRHRACWDWVESGPLIFAISLFAAPYAWASDQVLLLPALFAALRTGAPRAALPTAMLLSIAGLLTPLSGITFHSPVHIAIGAAWLLWYLLATYCSPIATIGRVPLTQSATGTGIPK